MLNKGSTRQIPLPREEVSRGFDWTILRRLLGYLRGYTRSLVLMYTLAIIAVGCTVTIPLLLQIGIDRYIVPGDLRGLAKLLTFLAALLAVLYWSNRYQGILMMKIGYGLLSSLRKDLVTGLQYLSFRFYDTHQAGQIMSRVTNDIQVLEELLRAGLDTVVVDVLTLVGLIAAMMILDLRLSLVLVITLPLFCLLVFGLQEQLIKRGRRIQHTLSVVNAFLNESISGIKVIRTFAREDENIRNFARINQEYYEEARTFYPLNALFWQSVVTLGLTGTALVLLGGGILLHREAISLGVIAAFLVYINRFFQPLQKISNMLNQMSRAMASAERIFSLMDETLQVSDEDLSEDFSPSRSIRGEVSFRNVWFAYEGEDYVVQDISFTARPGETLAVVGATGAGKSTIMNLLCRFYDPLRGSVLVDHQDLRTLPQQWFRSRIALVMQDAGIFSGTIAENVRFGEPRAPEERIHQVFQDMGVQEMIQSLPEGIHTQVGERGNNLSIGQRQIVAFARALIRDPTVLILDEAGAYLDIRTEQLVHKALERLRRGRTTFVIAHRLATIRTADRILVMHQGKIVEEGTHQELAAQNGRYACLLRHQR
ncbi:ATP-binding cassette, subfamily B/ATP-binding cassette, subfamily B, MsbA [Alkalispirochaeta americana]|uniref:ATP-binding cassette, subfamily B/ATP-binding cassette, subfamily B, MsbA n=1 Tax=Alkalispirochaeta americana TaxID=159291 RepID=A0A1N6TKD2_9SPIO|nr:ABC transporter ATP-binding protein [Alkalispirochaeta americana]SIQ53731.1 ATP-binding cassette, subfamily B/ATP-binding cassette, subfamily B, MsbA [Alkalispirochaeta americana]